MFDPTTRQVIGGLIIAAFYALAFIVGWKLYQFVAEVLANFF